MLERGQLGRDLPGDPDLRATWMAALKEVHPAGIIYMIDGRADEASLERAVAEAVELVSAQYPAGTRELVALHMFVNHSDAWATSPAVERDRLARVTDKRSSPRWEGTCGTEPPVPSAASAS